MTVICIGKRKKKSMEHISAGRFNLTFCFVVKIVFGDDYQ